MLKKLATALFILILAVVLLHEPSISQFKDYQKNQARIGTKTYTLHLAQTEEQKTRGLSYSKYLKSNEGMLFEFETPGFYGFWMKNMNYSIDILYLRDNRIVDIKENVHPSSYPTVYQPVITTNRVVELNAGEVAKNRAVIGSKVVIE